MKFVVMNRISTILTFIIIESCSPLKYGEYKTVHGEKLALHADSTFTFDSRIGWNQQYSNGKWYRSGRQLFFTSSFAEGEVPVILKSFSDPSRKGRLLKITGIKQYGDDLVRQLEFEFFVNGIKYSTGHADSLKINENIAVHSLQIVVRRSFNDVPYLIRDSVRSKEFKIFNESDNVFEFKCPEIVNAYNYIFWSGYVFRMKRHVLIEGYDKKKYFLTR